jgi:hypothetical protein
MKYICLGYMEPDKFETMSESERNALFVGRKAHWKEPRVGSSLCVTDFVSRRDHRVTEPEKNANQLDIEPGRAAARWIRAKERLSPVEFFLYSLTSAAALSAVLMGFFCMADFARQSASKASDPVSQELAANSCSALNTKAAK